MSISASATELNVLDGIPATLTATELGYVDGVTSSIQTQLNTKLSSVSVSDITGINELDTDLSSVSTDNDTLVSALAVKQYVDAQVVAPAAYTLSAGLHATNKAKVTLTDGAGSTNDIIFEAGNGMQITRSGATITITTTAMDDDILSASFNEGLLTLTQRDNSTITTTLPDATTDAHGLMTDDQFDKLAGIEALADVTDKANVVAALGLLNEGDTLYVGDSGNDTNVRVRGNLFVDGTTTTVNQTEVNVQNAFVFEGATGNDFETTLSIVDPTADRTISLPDITGTLVTTGDTGTIATGMIANLGVTTGKINSNAVTTGKLATGAVTTAKLADDGVTGAKIDFIDDSIATTDTHIMVADGTDYNNVAVSGDATLANDGTLTIANLAVETGMLANSGVTTAKIADDAITGAKIADDAIDSEHYTDGSIDTAHIGNDQVTYAKIQDVSATNVVLGRDSAGAGIIEEISASSLRTMLNIEDGADATDATNVNAAGALMHSDIPDSDTGFVKRTGSETYDIDTSTYLTAVAIGDLTGYSGGSDLAILDQNLASVSNHHDTIASAKAVKAYVDSIPGGVGGMSFVIEDGDGTELTIANDKEVKFVEGGLIDINWTDVSDGSDSDPYDLTFTVDPLLRNYTNTEADGSQLFATDDELTAAVAATAITGKALTNLGTGTGGAIAATDTILAAMQKLETRTALNDAKVTNTDIDVNIANLKARLNSDFGGDFVIGSQSDDIATFTGGVTVGGNLIVSGTTTTVNSNTVNIGDNIIVLNSDEAGSPSQDAGIEIERGSGSNKTLLWDEDPGKWTVGSETLVAATFEGNLTGDVTGNADTATLASTVTITANNSTDETVYPVFVDGATGTQGLESDTGLSYNPSTGLLTTVGLTASGTVQYGSLSDGSITVTAFESSLTSGATIVPTSAAVKTYVDAQVDTVDTFSEMGDTLFSTPANGHLAIYNGDSSKWVNALPTGTDTTTIDMTITGGAGTVAISADLKNPDGLTVITDDGAGSTLTATGTDEMLVWDASESAWRVMTLANLADFSISNGAGGISTFKTISVSGQDDVVADAAADTLTLAGTSIAITSTASSDTLAFNVNIDGLTALGGTGLHQTQDHFMFSDNGTEKKITFSNLEDAIFANVSGDATIAAGGALTIGAGAVENSMLADDAVGADELAANAVVNASIASDAAIDMDKLDGDSLATAITDFAQDDLVILSDTSDSGNLVKMTTSNFEDAIFGNVSGDIAIAAGGAATIQANSVALGTDTTGNYMTDVSAGTGIDITHTPAEGSTATIAVDVSDFMSNGANNSILTATGTDAMNAESTFTYDGAGVMKIDHSDRVTISLDGVKTSDATFAQIAAANDGDSVASIAFNRVGANDAADIAFHTQTTSTTSVAERMRITSEGNVGIGTTTPTVPLQVAGTLQAQQFRFNTNLRIGNPATNEMAIFTAGTERMRFDASGNVGVGTTSPDSILDVSATTPVLTVQTTASNSQTSSILVKGARSADGSAFGQLTFANNDDSGTNTGAYDGARILAFNDGGDKGGGLQFQTVPSGSSTALATALTIQEDTKIVTASDLTVSGNLIVSGDSITVNAETITTEEAMLSMGIGQTATDADALDFGFYGTYDVGDTQKFRGMFADASDSGKFKLFKDLQAEPSTTVDVSGTGFALADLELATLAATTLDISGNADIDGTLEADAITVGSVALAEVIQDTVGAMFTGNTETNITATYEDSDGTIDLVVSTGAGGLTDLVSDTSPQLGGDLDVQTHEIKTTSSNRDIVLRPHGTGGVIVSDEGESFPSTPTPNKGKLTVVHDGGTGPTLLLTDSDGDAASGPNLNLYRDSSSVNADDILGKISWHGNNNNAEIVGYGSITSDIVSTADGSENGRMNFGVLASGTHTTMASITSAGLGIGITSPAVYSSGATTLQVHDATIAELRLTTDQTGSATGNGSLIQAARAESTDNLYIWNKEAGKTIFATSGTERARIDASGNMGIGSNAPASLLHVGSNAYELSSGAYLVSSEQRTAKMVIHADDANTNWYSQEIGLALHNEDPTNNNWAPHIAFTTHEDDDGDPANANPVAVAAISATYNTRVANGWAKGDLVFFTNNAGSGNAERMRITSDGTLEHMKNTNAIAYHGRAAIGHTGHSDYAGFGHLDTFDTGGYALLQAANGKTFLNTESGQSIQFRVHNNDKMTLASDGKFGIGTTTPSSILHVKGGSGEAFPLILERPTTGGADFGVGLEFTMGDADDATAGHVYGRILACMDGANGNVDGSEDGYLRFDTSLNGSETEAMRILSSGNVGIGTTSPSTELHVSGADHPSIRVTGTDNANADPAIELLGTADNFTEGGQLWYDNGTGVLHLSSLYNNDAADIQFHTKTAADRSTSNVRMTIAGDGKVGIGDTNPIAAKLHVEVAGDTTTYASTNETYRYAMLLRNNTDTTDAFTGIAFDVSSESDFDSMGASIAAVRDTSAGSTAANHDANLVFATNDAGDDGLSERMRITHDGFVGIGTTSPEYKLDVTGSLRILPTISSHAGTAIRIGPQDNDIDVTLLRVDGNGGGAGTGNSGESDDSNYGFSLKYMGSGTGVNNRYALWMDNSDATALEAMSVLQDGKVGIGTATPAFPLEVDGFISTASGIVHMGDTNNTITFGTDTQSFNTNSVARMTIASDGAVAVAGAFSAATKSFDIEHPTKEGKRLHHGSLEGPEHGVYIRGRLEGDVIELPDYWLGLVDEDTITVQLTPNKGFQQIYVDHIEDNKVYVGTQTDTPIDCFYFIQGERKDVDKMVVEY